MTPEEWEKVSEVFHAAAEIDPAERDAFLSRACGNDRTMRLEVESLLAAENEAGDFISRPVIDGLRPPIPDQRSVSLIGAILGHYRVERRIGSGGMGDVFLATDMRLNRPVALKTLPSLFANDTGFLRRFRNEAQAAATLNHPNVATIYSVEDIDDRPVITMEYVEGATLDSYIPEGGIDIDTFLDWFRSLSDALVHAHEKGVIHRDIKPGNIMIASDGTPKILDFGLARIEARSSPLRSEELHITHPGQIIGTPSYMSPEQAEGKEVDQRTDIFSFGILMYEAITGIKPFKGDSHAEVVSNLLKSEPSSIGEVRTGVPPLLTRLIEKCLRKKRRNRYQSMREVRAILEETRAVEMRPLSMDSFQRKLTARPPRSPVVWIMAGIFVLIMAGAGYFFYSSRNPASPISFDNMTLRRLSQTNNVLFAHVTPDGRSVAYTTMEPNETRALWIRRVDDRNALQLLAPQPVQFWGGLTTDPDSSSIYYIAAARAARHGTLYRVSALGGQPRKLADTANDLGSLSPNGERILYVRYGEKTDLVSADAADGGDERVLHSVGNGSLLRDPQFSADGKLIYAIRFDRIDGAEYWSLVEIPAAGGAERVLIPRQKPRISEIAVLRDGSGMLLNSTDPASNLTQIYHFSPARRAMTRVTNDLNAYVGISVDAAGETFVSAQRYEDRWIWAGPTSEPSRLERVSSGPNAYATVAWTPDGRLLYDTVDNNRRHISVVRSDGSGVQQLTGETTNDFHPKASPDGRYIIFTSDRTGSNKVWRMNIDGGSPVQLSPDDAAADSPVLSPDGSAVYFYLIRNNERKLGRVSISGGEVAEMPLFGETLWALSPDGGRVAYAFWDAATATQRVGVRDLDSVEPFFVFDSSPIYILKWSRDGQSLIYRERDIGENPHGTIWLRGLRQKEPRVFYSSEEDNVLDISESPDGKMIAMVSTKLFSNAVMMTRTGRR